MIKNLLLVLCVTFVSASISFSQGELNCDDAELNALCDIDDIDGVVFTNPDPANSDVPSDALCTDGGAFHNPGWFSFVAGSTEIELLVTPLPMMCDTTPGGLTGIQVALWEGCPGAGGMCVAGNADCNDTPITLNAEDLVVGETYNLTIDGCGGSICTVSVDITSATAFALPDLDDVDEADAKYNFRFSCDNSLGDGNFCADQPVNFSVDDEFYETLGAQWEWSFTGPNIGDIEWDFGAFSGEGSPATIGDVDGEMLEGNGINVVFPDPGTYTICLNNVETFCDRNTEGKLTWEINVIEPGLQDFGVVSVCALDLLVGWEPDFEDEDGSPWIAGPITLDQVENASDGIISIETQDDCGCDFEQMIQVIVAGTIDREEVELYVWECMMPYTWYDITFDEFDDLPVGQEEVLREGSAESDYDGNVCDSLVSITIIPLTIVDTIIIGDCTSLGTEFTFVFTALDPDGNDVTITNPVIEWIDSTSNSVVATGGTALLESGSYYVDFLGSLQDLNYTDDELAGITLDSECSQIFGPFDLVGGSSTSPEIQPYQEVYCGDNLSLLTFTLDTLPDTDYTWVIPPSYNVIFQSEDSLAVSISTYVETDTLYAQAANGCGTSDSIPLPISITDGPDIDTNGAPSNCVGSELLVGYSGSAANIATYAWDVTGGNITTGDAASQNIGITYDTPGMFSYTLLVTDTEGCTSMESYDVDIEAPLENPMVTCDGDPTTIIFTWADVTGATSYDINDVTLPTGAITDFDAVNNTYTITGINPGDQATIQVMSVGPTSCVEIPNNVTCSASSCDISGIQVVNFESIEICLGDPANMPIQFEITLPANFSGLYTGRGVDPFTGLFDPNSPEVIAGTYDISFDFTDGGACEGMFMRTLTVNEIPSADIVPSEAVLCVGEIITLSGPGTVATWDFGADAVGDETGLSYTTPGIKMVSVMVEDPTSLCSSEGMIELTVNDVIEVPVIVCTPGTDNIQFDWQDITGVSEFEVSVSIGGGTPEVTTQTNSDFSQLALNEGDMVEIIVTAVADNGCNTEMDTESCQARTCEVPVIELSATQQIFCSNDVVSNAVNIVMRVDGASPADGTFTIEGDGVTLVGTNATFDPNGLAAGDYLATFTYTNPSDMCQTVDFIDFQVIVVLEPAIVLDNASICIDEVVTVNLPPKPDDVIRNINNSDGILSFINPDEFTLDYDIPGVFNIGVTYVVENCPDASVTEQVNVNDTIQTPNIVCVNVDTDFVEFGWQDQTLVTEYEIYIDGIFETNTTDSDFRIDGLSSGESVDIRVVAIDPICGNKENIFTCMAQSCLEPTWTSNIPDVQCYTPGSGPIVLDVEAMSLTPNSTGTLSWLEPEVNSNNEFTPGTDTQEYNFTALFTEGNCTSLFPVTFTINVEPVANLELVGENVICVGSSVSVESMFTPVANEEAIWDFDGASESGSGFGPYQVTFDTPGTYRISVLVDNEGCQGLSESVEITVEPELEAPVITCNSTDINSVELSWSSVDCADEYAVFVGGTQVTTTSNLNFTVTGLTENQEINVSVEAISVCACSNVMSQDVSCTTKPCDPTTWSFSSNVTDEFCLDGSVQSFTITATPDDLSGNGTGTWSGDPISNATIGEVDPSLVAAGTYDVNYAYEEAGCFYTTSVQLTFVPEPTLELTAMDPACAMDDVGSITAIGMGGSPGYMFAIDGGSLQSSGDFSNLTIGTHTVDIVDANGCANSASISILAPVTPSVTIQGANSVIIDNDAMYTIDIQNAENIENIIWTIAGNVVCSGANCLNYTVIGASQDFVINVDVIYDGGCMVSAAEFAVNVKEIQAFYIPNTVALNSVDGNGEWKIFIKGSETFPKSITIYDRWGNLMHEAVFNLTMGEKQVVLWDGTSDNTELATGVYVYVLQIEVDGRNETIGGDVTILR